MAITLGFHCRMNTTEVSGYYTRVSLSYEHYRGEVAITLGFHCRMNTTEVRWLLH